MSESNAPIPVKPVLSWREMAVKWLIEQSLSTILLLGLAVGMFHYIPRYVVPLVQQGYTQNANTLERSMKAQIDSHEDQFKLMMESHDRDRELLDALLEVRLREVRVKERTEDRFDKDEK